MLYQQYLHHSNITLKFMQLGYKGPETKGHNMETNICLLGKTS